MSATPYPGFSELVFPPSWSTTYSIDFRHDEAMLGNFYPLIQDGGTADPIEVATVSRIMKKASAATILSDINNAAGATPLNWRMDNQVPYKLWYMQQAQVRSISPEWDEISTSIVRHPDPQYAALPAIASSTPPYAVLPAPFAWSSDRSYNYNVVELGYGESSVRNRRSASVFAAQNRISVWNVQINDAILASSRFNTVHNFLLARRGLIPLRVSADGIAGNANNELWVCQRWSWRKEGRRSASPAALAGDGFYTFQLELKQVYRRTS